MAADTNNLFLLEDLEDPGKTSRLAEGELHALRIAADWIGTFIVKPNKDLGRAGPVCPFVPFALERKTLWLAPEHLASRSPANIADLLSEYASLFRHTLPVDSNDANYKAIVVVFADASSVQAMQYFGDARIQSLKRPSY